VVHVVVVIRLALLFKVWQRSGSCFRWFYCLPLLFKVWQRSGSCCCYIVHLYCFRFYRREVHLVVVVILSTIIV